MALPSAIMVGAIAALAVPYAIGDLETEFGQFIRDTSIRLDFGSVQVTWSWMLFAIITLFAWGFFAWAQK